MKTLIIVSVVLFARLVIGEHSTPLEDGYGITINPDEIHWVLLDTTGSFTVIDSISYGDIKYYIGDTSWLFKSPEKCHLHISKGVYLEIYRK